MADWNSNVTPDDYFAGLTAELAEAKRTAPKDKGLQDAITAELDATRPFLKDAPAPAVDVAPVTVVTAPPVAPAVPAPAVPAPAAS